MTSLSTLATGLPIAIFVGFGVLVIVVIVLANRARQRRIEEFQALAAQLGFTYLGDASIPNDTLFSFDLFSLFGTDQPPTYHETFARELTPFRPFSAGGHSRSIENLIAGTKDGVDWFLLDYNYSTGSGKSQTNYNHSVLAARMPMMLPALEIGSENFFTRIGKVFSRDIEFESEEFNKRFLVNCPDRKAAYDIIHPGMMEYLMGLPDRDWQFGNCYGVMVFSSRQEPSAFLQAMLDMDGFTDRIPQFIREDRGIPGA